MAITSSLRFIYIFDQSGPLCAAVFAVARQSNGDSPESPPFYYADIIIIMAKGAKEEQKFAAPIFELVAKWDDE